MTASSTSISSSELNLSIALSSSCSLSLSKVIFLSKSLCKLTTSKQLFSCFGRQILNFSQPKGPNKTTPTYLFLLQSTQNRVQLHLPLLELVLRPLQRLQFGLVLLKLLFHPSQQLLFYCSQQRLSDVFVFDCPGPLRDRTGAPVAATAIRGVGRRVRCVTGVWHVAGGRVRRVPPVPRRLRVRRRGVRRHVVAPGLGHERYKSTKKLPISNKIAQFDSQLLG